MSIPQYQNLDIIHPYFLNGWKNFGDIFENVEIFKNKDGLVTLSGLITGDYSKIMFRLPEGWKPKNQLIFSVMSDNITRRLDINSNGELFINNDGSIGKISGNGWVSLDGISFYAKH